MGKAGLCIRAVGIAAHKLLSKAERDERRLERHVLRKPQDQIRAASDKEEQLNGIIKAVELAFGFTANLEQIDLLWSLVFDREDRILVAKTGHGKSVVPQLLPLLTRSSIVIVLLPLNALGAEQLADIQRLPLPKPIWLSSKNNNAATLRRIRAGIFTHVLVIPEIACSLRFYEIHTYILKSSWPLILCRMFEEVKGAYSSILRRVAERSTSSRFVMESHFPDLVRQDRSG